MYKMKGAKALPDIALTTMMTSFYFRLKERFPTLDEYLHVSNHYDYGHPMRIVAKTRIGSEHMLRVFHCFDDDVYYGILLSIFIISCLTSVQKKSFNVWVKTFWAYLT